MSRSGYDDGSDYEDGYADVTVSCFVELPVCPLQSLQYYVTTENQNIAATTSVSKTRERYAQNALIRKGKI